MPPQAATSQQALGNLQNFQKNMQDPSQMQTAQETQLGVPQAQQQVSGLRQAITNTTNLLNNVPSSVMGRTGGSLVTSAQANAQIQNEQAPIAQNLNQQGTQLNNASSDLNTLLGQATTRTGLQEQGQQDKLGILKDIYTSLFGSEQAKASQKLEQQKLTEQAREANQSNATSRASIGASGSSDAAMLASLLGGGASSGSKPASSPSGGVNMNAIRQNVLQHSSTTQSLLSDYGATLASAIRGNKNDLAKVATYFQMNPNLFSKSYQSVVDQLISNPNRKGSLASPAALTNYLVNTLKR